jgi:phosphopantetheinyl transferase (holo-ACP synthase)
METLHYFIEQGDDGKEASRKCLKQGLKHFEIEKPATLDISDHLHFTDYPHILTSLSHTQTMGAACVASVQNVRSVGIDIEYKTRVLKEKLQKYFLHEKDPKDLDFLTIWVIKEACFKAFFPLRKSIPIDKTWVLKDFWIDQSNFGIKDAEYPIGKYQIHDHKDLIVATAWL